MVGIFHQLVALRAFEASDHFEELEQLLCCGLNVASIARAEEKRNLVELIGLVLADSQSLSELIRSIDLCQTLGGKALQVSFQVVQLHMAAQK